MFIIPLSSQHPAPLFFTTIFHFFRFEQVLTAKANKLWSKLKALSLMDGRGYLVKHPPSSFSQSGTAQLLPFSLS
jgi:hypothetical protein